MLFVHQNTLSSKRLSILLDGQHERVWSGKERRLLTPDEHPINEQATGWRRITALVDIKEMCVH